LAAGACCAMAADDIMMAAVASAIAALRENEFVRKERVTTQM
jgi:hypothetical protein